MKDCKKLVVDNNGELIYVEEMEEVGFDELFYQLRKCHHKAVELNECQEVIMARHLLDHCVIYLKPAKNTQQPLQPD